MPANASFLRAFLLLVLAFGQLSENEHQEDGGNAGRDDGDYPCSHDSAVFLSEMPLAAKRVEDARDDGRPDHARDVRAHRLHEDEVCRIVLERDLVYSWRSAGELYRGRAP